MAARSPSVRGAGVTPPSGDRFMFRELHGSKFSGVRGPANGKPSGTISDVRFHPPMPALRSRNSAGVMAPDRSASSPYWTPTLSHGTRAKPSSPTP